MIKKINNNNNNLKIPDRHLLDRVAFYGRTLSEYLMMFGIDDIDHLKTYNTILDCPSGTSSFVAESNNNYGINTVGRDTLFDLDSSILQKKARKTSNML
jgi:hypothetical protein